MKIASITEVRTNFSAIIKTTKQEPIVVTRNGKPVALVVPVTDEDEFERLMMAHSPRLQAILTAARDRIRAGQGLSSEAFWAAVKGGKDTTNRRPRKRKTA
ncbi:MAG: type II toxin-antitoxin system Phd/YefM family antitoxin [Planctomycetes bacterium]|nr:type II toxin-antitoxin system Phd/YefM family antitoxin [Planctomycetota bacterium]